MIKETFKALIIGFVTIVIFNKIGQYYNLNIPLNLLTIMIIGLLKLPGLIIVLFLLLIWLLPRNLIKYYLTGM